jgi:hypothetical protein
MRTSSRTGGRRRQAARHPVSSSSSSSSSLPVSASHHQLRVRLSRSSSSAGMLTVSRSPGHLPPHNSLSVEGRFARELLRSITDLAFMGEADDSRLLPTIDAWLDGRLPFLQFQRGGPGVVDSTDPFGSTLLMIASCFGKVQTVRRLLAAGADFNRVNASGRCALVYACLGPDLREQKGAIITMLLQAGARHHLSKALEASALLGRKWSIRILAAFGALPPGQLVTITRRTGKGGGPSVDQVPEMRSAMARIVCFDATSGCYACDVLATVHPTRAGAMRAVDLRVSVLPSELDVTLHHMGTENALPILALGANPLDVAAAALAGAPKALDDAPKALDDAPAAIQAAGGAGDLLTNANRGVGEVGGASCAPAPAGATAARGERSSERLAAGCAVKIVRRPEQWLRGRYGHVHSWDESAQRYMVLLPHTQPGVGSAATLDEAVPGPVPILLRRTHLEAIHTEQPQLQLQQRPSAAPAEESTGLRG